MSGEEQTSVLKAENLKKRYGRRLVVDGVNLQVSSGQIIGLLGRNGAGKTTTFQMIVGLIKPNEGTITLDGTNISFYSTHKRAKKGITYLPQEDSVFLKTSVEKNINMILQLQGQKKSERKETIDRLLNELGLQDLAKQSSHALSGGERRRLEICRSLVIKPKFLLLDEPFTGIDPLTIKELQKIFLELKHQRIGIVISDHNVRDTLKIADYAYVINEGKILVGGTPEKVALDEGAKEKFLGHNFKLGDQIKPYDRD